MTQANSDNRSAGSVDDALWTTAHDTFRAMMLGGSHPCLGGAAAIRRGYYRLGCYGELSSRQAVEESARDLSEFLRMATESERPVSVHVAVFRGPEGLTEEEFERSLWEHLRGMRRTDVGVDGSAPKGRLDFEADPGFVFADRNLFVVGLHPGASRKARHFPWPTLVFNALSHGDPLRDTDQYDRITEKIRARDVRLQGSLNPSIFQLRVAQFSGREVGPDWTCPVDLD